MPEGNFEIVRGIIDAVNRGDLDAAIEKVSQDCEADWSNSRGPLSGIYQGRDGMRELISSFLEAWESVRWEVEEWIELEGDRVVTVSQFHLRGQESGVEVSARGASIWTIRDGEATALTLYQSQNEALAAAGLPQ